MDKTQIQIQRVDLVFGDVLGTGAFSTVKVRKVERLQFMLYIMLHA
jgi:hypothetical protein